MMVVALGRLGMREFDLASDADLLFIFFRRRSAAAASQPWAQPAPRSNES